MYFSLRILLNVTAIVFLIGAGAGEGDFLPLEVGEKVLVNELTTIVRFQS